MKTELIEYHRGEADWNKAHGTEVADELVRFHERAVAWLESLDEGLAISAAAETQIQQENQLSAADAEEERLLKKYHDT